MTISDWIIMGVALGTGGAVVLAISMGNSARSLRTDELNAVAPQSTDPHRKWIVASGAFCPKISMYLKRYHDVSVSPSGVWRILSRANLNRLPASQRYKRHSERWKRYEKQQPGHAVQIDVKFIEPIKGVRKKHYQYTAIDDCTRLRVLKIVDRLDQKTAIRSLEYVLEKLPFKVDLIQTDNGSEFQAGFHVHVLDRGIRHVYIKPNTPRLNGKVERSHRIDDEEFYRMLAGVVIDDSKLFNAKLQEWERFYNFQRPHGAPGGQTPYERIRQLTRPSV